MIQCGLFAPNAKKGVRRKRSNLFFLIYMQICPRCNGDTYYAEHDITANHGEYGECQSCPVKCPCEICQMTGEVSDEYMEAVNRKVLDDNGLPF